jgi:hypothetical protein
MSQKVKGGKEEGGRLLADEQHVDGAEVEVVVEGKGSEAIIGGMLTGIKL